MSEKIAAYQLRDRYPGGVTPDGVAILYQSEPRARKVRVLGWEDAPADYAYITLIVDDVIINRRMIIQRKEVEVLP